MKIIENKKENENKSELKELFALWKKESTKNTVYYTGNLTIDNKKHDIVVFANNKTNDKQPDYRIYLNDENKKSDDSIISLWKTTAKSGLNYYSGLDNENKKVIAFNNNKSNDFQPDIVGYYK